MKFIKAEGCWEIGVSAALDCCCGSVYRNEGEGCGGQKKAENCCGKMWENEIGSKVGGMKKCVMLGVVGVNEGV